MYISHKDKDCPVCVNLTPDERTFPNDVQKISNLIYNMPMTDRQSQFRERENELKEAGLL